MNHKMEKPKSIPWLASVVKYARHARRFKNRVTQYTVGGAEGRGWAEQGSRRTITQMNRITT